MPHPPVVYHVHTVGWSLFARHVPRTDLAGAVAQAVASADGYVCFGRHAQAALERIGNSSRPSVVSYLPTTITAGTPAAAWPLPNGAGQPLATLYGFPADWKHPEGLIEAFALATRPLTFLLAGPYWDQHMPASTFRVGPVRVVVTARYLDAAHRRRLVEATDFAVFAYRPDAGFQGSGAIADYLHGAVPVLATDVGNLAELVADAGIVVPPGDMGALAATISLLAGDPAARGRLRARAERRRHLFTPGRHAAACLAFYRQLVGG